MNLKKDNAHDKSSSSLSDCHVERDSEHDSIRSGRKQSKKRDKGLLDAVSDTKTDDPGEATNNATALRDRNRNTETGRADKGGVKKVNSQTLYGLIQQLRQEEDQKADSI